MGLTRREQIRTADHGKLVCCTRFFLNEFPDSDPGIDIVIYVLVT